jgi:magnesium chelatase family protein
VESPGPSSEASKAIRERVTVSQQRQLRRAGKTNAWLDPGEIRRDCRLSVEDEDYLTRAMTQLKLSTRSFFRILKISRTIADLEGAGQIERQHLLEAISLRFPGSQLE